MLLKMLGNVRLLKYLVMACVIVTLELIAFQVIYLVSGNYQAATVLSFIFAVLLNWLGSRTFVFNASRFTPAREFMLVLTASIVGLGVQVGVVYVSVETLALYPLIGKILSIGFSFFWNYWFRARFIFDSKHKPTAKDAETAVY